MSTAIITSTTSRPPRLARTDLRAARVASGLSLVLQPSRDAALLAAYARWLPIEAERIACDALPPHDPTWHDKYQAYADRWHDAAYQVRDRPARTREGIAAKAHVLRSLLDNHVGFTTARAENDRSVSPSESFAWSLVNDLLAGKPGVSGRSLPGATAKLDAMPTAGTAADHPDAALLADCAAFAVLEQEFNATDFDAEPGTPAAELADAEQTRIADAQRAVADRMIRCRPVTLEGHMARAQSLVLWAPDSLGRPGSCTTERLAHAILRDLAGSAQA